MVDMKQISGIKSYPPAEEKINRTSHAVGFLLSLVALVLLINRAILYGNFRHAVAGSIFGASLLILYGASTWYHSSTEPRLRVRLRIFDHAAIYILIAGTYTPFTLITLQGPLGWALFGISWALALTGIILKLFFTGKYPLVSTQMYLGMGWLIIFAIKPLVQDLPHGGFLWLLAGGLSYTLGATLYNFAKIKFNHAIFHLSVLLGSFSHFMAVFFYVLPGQ